VADAGTQGFVTQRGGASAIARSILALKLADLRRIDMIDGGSSSRPEAWSPAQSTRSDPGVNSAP